MTNFKTICTIVICVLHFAINAQEKKAAHEVFATFEISDARDNGNDITPGIIENNARLVLYKSFDNQEIMLANYWEKSNSQSFGRIYSIIREAFPETEKELKHELYHFQWSYINSYDDKKGTAKISLLVIYKPQGIYYECTILPENLDVLVYKGLMTGDLKALENSIKK
jgi:hypothetical protein